VLFLSTISVFGQIVSIKKVDFKTLKNGWLLVEVITETNRNTLPEAFSDEYIEDIAVRLYLGFRNSKITGGIDYYYSEVAISILERGDENKIKFFIPGKIMEMNRYTKPNYYFAEVLVSNKPQAIRGRPFSQNFKSRASLDKFVQKTKSLSSKNLGQLMPSFITPLSIKGSYNFSDPTYIRSE
tara:strand:- start:901 stop:1449 length:549 start_codon:yes stop_codon:yes gene_type:complete